MLKDNFVYNFDSKTFLERLYESYGDNSVNMFLLNIPYYNAESHIDTERFFECLKKTVVLL